jgi:hypothetical protein
MFRATHFPAESEYDDDDRIALEVLGGPLGGSGLDKAYPSSRPSLASDVVLAQQSLARMSPIAEVAFRILAAATMKAQTRGRIPRRVHEWVDQVLSRDLSVDGEWLLLNTHLPLAVAAGIEVDALIAFHEGRLDDLADADRQNVDFIRAVVNGEVSDDLWTRQVAIVGSQRGVLEQICLIMHLVGRIRITQALGGAGITNEQLDALLRGYRDGTLPVPDIAGYERFYNEMAFPLTGP